MKDRPYSNVMSSLMHAQVYTRPNLSFIVSILIRYLSNPSDKHWIAIKKVIRYLQKPRIIC